MLYLDLIIVTGTNRAQGKNCDVMFRYLIRNEYEQ